jgi:hypothetical protein
LEAKNKGCPRRQVYEPGRQLILGVPVSKIRFSRGILDTFGGGSHAIRWIIAGEEVPCGDLAVNAGNQQLKAEAMRVCGPHRILVAFCRDRGRVMAVLAEHWIDTANKQKQPGPSGTQRPPGWKSWVLPVVGVSLSQVRASDDVLALVSEGDEDKNEALGEVRMLLWEARGQIQPDVSIHTLDLGPRVGEVVLQEYIPKGEWYLSKTPLKPIPPCELEMRDYLVAHGWSCWPPDP